MYVYIQYIYTCDIYIYIYNLRHVFNLLVLYTDDEKMLSIKPLKPW